MDPILLEILKFLGPAAAAAVASYFAGRERLRVLEVKFEAIVEWKDEVKKVVGNLQDEVTDLQRGRAFGDRRR